MPKNLATLESLLGYQFKDVKHLERALTHRSWAYENLSGKPEEEIRQMENESFEFVGDSVLGLVIADELYRRNPKLSEGDLTLMKHHLVSTGTLARVARELGLGEYLRVGRGEEKSGGRKKQALLANTLEAVIAAVFFDSSYTVARSFVTRLFSNELKQASPRLSVDYKTMLQEVLQSKKLEAPMYSVVKTDGKPHARTFFVEAIWQGGKAEGSGRSIKSAEMMAAHKALETLGLSRTAGVKRGK